MKTSARNQFSGKVSGVRAGSVNDEIELQIAPGQSIVATVTRASREALGLEHGTDAIALVKASSIVLVTDGDGMKFSARNQLAGTVRTVQKGAVNSEVIVELPHGGAVVAMVTNASADALGLAAGTKATAMFKASSVLLAVKATR
jgi:molybdate transport system regulatory protein